MKTDDTKVRKSAAYKKLRRQKIVIGVFCFLIFVMICLFSPLFNVSEISVSGTNILSPDDVLDASGIKKGDNFLFVDTDKSEKNINALGYVDKVEVKRKFFTRIEIEVTEATECAYVTFSGSYVGIDAKGKVLSIVKSNNFKPKKTLVTGFGIKAPEKGDTVKPKDNKKFEVLKSLLKLLKERKMLANTTKIRLEDTKNIKVILYDRLEIRLGDELELDYKMDLVNTILEDPSNYRGGTLDVSDTANVIFKPKE